MGANPALCRRMAKWLSRIPDRSPHGKNGIIQAAMDAGPALQKLS
jgi:hypothetical protein